MKDFALKRRLATVSKREGPSVQFDASCFGCAYEHREHYAAQGDSGCNVTCMHPDASHKRDIGDTNWTTPKWCPLLAVAIESFVREQK